MAKNTDEWIIVFTKLREYYCTRCDFACNPDRRVFCMEQFLRIAEDWEVVNDYHKQS